MMTNSARKRGGKKGGDGVGRGEGRTKIPTVAGGLSQPLFPFPPPGSFFNQPLYSLPRTPHHDTHWTLFC